MCTRFALTSPPPDVAVQFGGGAFQVEPFPPRYNISPTQPVHIVRLDHARRKELTLVRWGLIPSWSKDPTKYAPLVNARAETAAEKPSFRGPLRHRRCLVPADAWYDWPRKGTKHRLMLRPAASGPFALAGLWAHWLGADGSEIETMAVLTVPAVAGLDRYCERMPVLIPPSAHEAWLDTASGRSNLAEGMLVATPAAELQAVEIGPAIDNPRSDGQELQKILGRINI